MKIKERPMIMGAESIRGIYARWKTQTRRVLKPQPNNITSLVEWNTAAEAFVPWNWTTSGSNSGGARTGTPISCPYGVPGDRLWVREAWAKDSTVDGGARYYATDQISDLRKKRSPLFMPRWASRLLLEVTAVRVERLHEITPADAIAEGVRPRADCFTIDCDTPNPVDEYRGAWNFLNAKRGFPWDRNPWVWVVEFRLLAEVA